jgi:hypothetical protein
MNFAKTDEQRALHSGLEAFLATGSVGWDDVATGFGLEALGRSEGEGGLGTGAREAAVVASLLGPFGLGDDWAGHWVAMRTAEGSNAGGADWKDDALTLLHCAEIVGLCRAMLADAVAYSKERHQFGKAIGSFQALRHRMVDMRLSLEQAAAMTDYAIDLIDGDAPARAKAVSAARVLAGDAARVVGGGAVQVHGAMGLTEELRVGRLFRRAALLALCDGTERSHLTRYAAA